MPPADDQQKRVPSGAMVADGARRAGAARAIAAVFLVLTVVAFVTLLRFAHPRAAIFQLISAVGYASGWWFARARQRPSVAGALIIAGLLLQHVFTSSSMTLLTDAVSVAWFAALAPLIAAATLAPRGVVATGAAGALALAVQLAMSLRFGADAQKEFVSPALYFASTWVVATFASIASHRALRAHIEEERRAQEAQNAAALAEARYRLVADHVSDLVGLLDAEGRYVYASPSFARVLGVEPDQIVGRQSPELVHPDDLPPLKAAFGRALDGEAVSLVARLRAASGAFGWFHVSLSGVSSLSAGEGGERGVAVSARDISEQRALSEALEKTRRVEALGNLAGGVAHDFNNLLMVIQSCTDLAASRLPPNHPARLDLSDIGGAVKHAAALTRQLLTFARRQVMPPSGKSIAAQTAQELAPILARLCSQKIAFSLVTDGSKQAVAASAVQLEQILMNLTANACDAMPDGGKLSVEIRDRTLSPEEASELTPGSYVELSVRDTGTGMSPEVQERIFEPFFTTKPLGRGTGLGLATVYGLVSQLGGRIAVRSAPGAGSTFTVLLPVSRLDDAHPATFAAELEPKGTLDILLVEDEPAVRTSITRVLCNAGHRVTEADAIESALAAAGAPGARFDAIVTDVVIGADDAIQPLERLRAAQPHAAVVVMSGYTPSPERVAKLTEQGAEFLAKPFSASDLLAALARARQRVSS